MCDKRDDFDFEIVNFPFIDGDVPRSTSYESIYLNSFVLLEHLAMLLNFNTCNKLSTQKLLQTRLSVS